MGPSVFRKITEEATSAGIANMPSNSTGWLVSTNELIKRELETNEYVCSLSNTSEANLKTLITQRSTSTKADEASIIVPSTNGLTAKKLVSPRPQGHLISGPDGQTSGLVPPGPGKIGMGFLTASGDNIQAPSVGGVFITDAPPTSLNTSSTELSAQATPRPMAGDPAFVGPINGGDGFSPYDPTKGDSSIRATGSPHNGRSAGLIESLYNSAAGNPSNGHLPKDIDPKTGKETPVHLTDGESFYGTNTRTGTAYRTLTDIVKDLFNPAVHGRTPFSVPGIGGTVRVGK